MKSVLVLSVLFLICMCGCVTQPERKPVAGVFPAFATAQGDLGLLPLQWTDAAVPVSLSERAVWCPDDVAGGCLVASPCTRADTENCAPPTMLKPGQNMMQRSIGLAVEPTDVR